MFSFRIVVDTIISRLVSVVYWKEQTETENPTRRYFLCGRLLSIETLGGLPEESENLQQSFTRTCSITLNANTRLTSK